MFGHFKSLPVDPRFSCSKQFGKEVLVEEVFSSVATWVSIRGGHRLLHNP